MAALLVVASLVPVNVSAGYVPTDYVKPAATTVNCDEQAELDRYDDGELSETRESEWFPHSIKVTHFCADDTDVDSAFDWLLRGEARFHELFGDVIAEDDGKDKTLHVVLGNGGALCRRYGFGGCGDIDWGRVYQTCRTSEDQGPKPDPGCEEHGVVFTSADPDETGWFRNIVHEHGHLLDFLYIYMDSHFRTWGGPLTDWWREGMPEYLQMSLRESLGLSHRPDRVRTYNGRNLTGPDGVASDRGLSGTIVRQNGMNDYLSGRALVRYLAEEDPGMLRQCARHLGNSVWRDDRGIWDWWRLMDKMQRKHRDSYREWNKAHGADLNQR